MARLSDVPETRGALEEIRATTLVRFLARQGWETVAGSRDQSYVVLVDPSDDGQQVKVPLDKTFTDYLDALEIAVERTAEVFELTSRDLLSKLAQEQYDILLVSAEIDSGSSMSAEDGLVLLDATWRVLTASAWAEDVGSRRALYVGPRSERLTSFLGRVRLAHSVPGSFTFPFLSPVPEPEHGDDMFDFVVESFERRAMRKTVGAVNAAVESALDLRDRDVFTFRERIPDGVSANLCRALSELPEDFPTRIKASWSPLVPESGRTTTVQPGLSEAFGEAADRLGPEIAEGRVTIVGHVRLLHREHGDDSGEIGVRSILRDSPGVFRVDLDPVSYALAVEAHAADRTVLVEGEVDRYGSGRRLLDAEFKVLGVSLPEYFDDSPASEA